MIYETFPQYYAHKMFKLASDRGHKDATMISAEQTLHGIHNQTGDCPSALRFELFNSLRFLSDFNPNNFRVITPHMKPKF